MNYFNPYTNFNNYQTIPELQQIRDNAEAKLRMMQQNPYMQQPANITQNFQLSPQTNNSVDAKIVKNIEELKNIFVANIGLFILEDYSQLYIKDGLGNIRTFNTNEVIELTEEQRKMLALEEKSKQDELIIQSLQKQIENLKEVSYAKSDGNNVNESTENEKSTRISSSKSTVK